MVTKHKMSDAYTVVKQWPFFWPLEVDRTVEFIQSLCQ